MNGEKFKLRKLKTEDAKLMIEWMHDEDVVKYMKANFKEKQINDCKNFINFSNNDKNNLNLAIVNENDEYLGTVSLKNIDYENKNAEFAITIRKIAMGGGCATFAIKKIIEIGFDVLKLENIYWYVSSHNTRAIKFYDKNMYEQVSYNDVVKYTDEEDEDYIWYLVKKNI